MKAPRRRSNDIKNRSSRVEEGEVDAALPASQSSDNVPPPALRRGSSAGSRSSQGRESRASFRLDASTMELEMAGAAPDTLEMAVDVLRSPEQEAIHPPPPQSSGKVSKTRVVFSLVGKVKEKMRARDRETLVSFKQLGRLAPPTPLQISGPTLQEVVGKHRIKEENEIRSMLPPEATTTPHTGARMAVTQWLSTVETPDSLAPTVQGTESPTLLRSHAGSTLTSSKLRAPIYCPPEPVSARNLDSGCQSSRGSVPCSPGP